MFRFLVALIAITLAATQADAARRLALVFGNDAYEHVVRLEKAGNDAASITESLKAVGFEVDTVLDGTRREMNRAIVSFTASLQPGDTALVFYAGHGVEIQGENYLLPVDVEAPDAGAEDLVQLESVALSDLMFRIQETGARTTLMFIDACRDNPFAATNGRSIGGARGLARITAAEGSFVVFSAGARQQALDRLDDQDTAQNSVFTRLLLPKLTQPDLELRRLVADLRVEVRDLALTRDHAQFPAYYDELLGQFYFSSSRGLAPQPVGTVETDAPDAGPDATPAGDIRADFDLARRVGTAAAYEAFLQKYGGRDDLAVSLAETALRSLKPVNPTEDGAAPESDVAAVEPAPVPTPAPAPTPKPAPETARHIIDARERVRATQAALTARGCNAGGADGIVGARTRAAFQAFIRASGKDLDMDALGSQHALDVINATRGTVCKAAVVSPDPGGGTNGGGGSPDADGLDIAGTWSYTATCILGLRVTGTERVTRTGPNSYRSSKADSLGQRASGTISVSGRSFSGRFTFSNGVAETTSGTLGPDGRSMSGRASSGCTFTARKLT